jgi:hypothetical protein
MSERDLLRLLMRDGPSSARSIAAALRISQPTFSRLANRVGDDVVVGGRVRHTRYAARRKILGVANELSVYVVDSMGVVRRAGQLQSVHPGLLWTSSDGVSSTWLDDLPWFLADARPAGFLGRQVPRRYPELELPDDVRLWSSDHVLRFVSRYGFDLVGNVVVGEPALQRLREHEADVVDEADYPRLADLELAAGTAGSSAGGEQPKFLARRRHEGAVADVLVKFSPPHTSAVGRRVADLLVCEHLALQALSTTMLAAQTMPVATTRVLRADGRTFLEVERFDRVGAHGRRGLVSLAALDDAFVGSEHHAWPSTTQALVKQRRLAADVHHAARVAWAFGQSIDNTDMHLGNLSVWVDDTLALGGLAPIYDMLPMRYAPIAGQVVERAAPRRVFVDDDIAEIVVPAAQRFWQSVAACTDISDDVRRLATDRP